MIQHMCVGIVRPVYNYSIWTFVIIYLLRTYICNVSIRDLSFGSCSVCFQVCLQFFVFIYFFLRRLLFHSLCVFAMIGFILTFVFFIGTLPEIMWIASTAPNNHNIVRWRHFKTDFICFRWHTGMYCRRNAKNFNQSNGFFFFSFLIFNKKKEWNSIIMRPIFIRIFLIGNGKRRTKSRSVGLFEWIKKWIKVRKRAKSAY